MVVYVASRQKVTFNLSQKQQEDTALPALSRATRPGEPRAYWGHILPTASFPEVFGSWGIPHATLCIVHSASVWWLALLSPPSLSYDSSTADKPTRSLPARRLPTQLETRVMMRQPHL